MHYKCLVNFFPHLMLLLHHFGIVVYQFIGIHFSQSNTSPAFDAVNKGVVIKSN